MTDNNEWLVIVNPNAGNGRGEKEWQKISDTLKSKGLSFSVKFTERKEHAIIIALNGITEGFRKIITVGGDGTLNEVVNGTFMNTICPTTDISLALIPVGTGNDWGRLFGIPLDHEKAIEIIYADKQMPIDIGQITYFDGDKLNVRHFINTAGLGFESVVVQRTNKQKEKGHGNRLSYFYNLLMGLLSYKNTRAIITLDDETIKRDVFSINIGNGRYCGGGMRQTPRAIPDDGLLDVTIISGMGKLEMIANIKMLYDGTILHHPKIDAYQCKSIKITSTPSMFTEADGESLGHTPVEFRILPSSINIVYGKRFIP